MVALTGAQTRTLGELIEQAQIRAAAEPESIEGLTLTSQGDGSVVAAFEWWTFELALDGSKEEL